MSVSVVQKMGPGPAPAVAGGIVLVLWRCSEAFFGVRGAAAKRTPADVARRGGRESPGGIGLP
jgi:hypothetical protein